ncbi:nitric oxide reductase FlRd-NAD(+) reductase [Moorella thermoacetica]|uniref:Nitric oxide reductase FlRd-NAD(+) reductase n=1 Tax=Neomoorella thermoacetica TaxID=1525 RepID=A0A1J5JXL9_NEOTH|nr:FAD-dependent oxidoreductase [Moorella thermoacetica]OIQ08297.1 nitric oxide reductase FlRd-NAD(+) reductase [Moorella thermoacetica]
MKRTDILVAGGGIAGCTAALAARRYYSDKKITLVRREIRALLPWGLAYACGAGSLNEYILGDSRLYKEGIELVIDEVTTIDPGGKRVTTAFGEKIAYDKLILAIGSSPVTSLLKGTELPGVFVLKKELPYLKSLKEHLARARNVVIVGGGLNGVELAAACSANHQLHITLVEQLPRCLSGVFNDDTCILIEEKLRRKGVAIITRAAAEELEGCHRVEGVRLTGGRTLPADVVVLATGIVPNTLLARQAGLATDENAGILVDEYMQTSATDVFAIGDCAVQKSLVPTGGSLTRQAGPAGHEARVAAANLFGLKRAREITVKKISLAIGDLVFGSVGLIKIPLAETGTGMPTTALAHDVIAKDLAVKVVYVRETGATLGAEVYGKPLIRVRETMNNLASAIERQTPFTALPLA